jgi:glycosyltransferase involved in cell wall biosynthesis
MNPFIGARHYQDESYELPGSFAKWDASVRLGKKKVLDKIPTDNLRLIAPSQWMANQIAASELMGRFRINVVPYGLDTREFCPLEDRNALRRSLGIPVDKKIVGFIAQNISEHRKGFHLLVEAFQGAPHLCREACLLTVGEAHVDVPCVEHIHLGSTNNNRILRLFYNAIDFFVCPSIADNLPNTILEAMSCGTPAVAFDVGGIPDMVRPGSTGWLAQPVGSSRELRNAIETAFLFREDRHGFRSNCRALACSEYTEEKQAERVVAIYKEILDRANGFR